MSRRRGSLLSAFRMLLTRLSRLFSVRLSLSPCFFLGVGLSRKSRFRGFFLCFNLSRSVTLSVLSKKWLLLPLLSFPMLSAFRPLSSAALSFGSALFLPVGFLTAVRSITRVAPVAVSSGDFMLSFAFCLGFMTGFLPIVCFSIPFVVLAM